VVRTNGLESPIRRELMNERETRNLSSAWSVKSSAEPSRLSGLEMKIGRTVDEEGQKQRACKFAFSRVRKTMGAGKEVGHCKHPSLETQWSP